MKKFYVLGAAAVASFIGFILIWALGGRSDDTLRLMKLAVYASVATAAWSTAAYFGTRDRMRWAWASIGLGHFMNFGDMFLRGPTIMHASDQTDVRSMVMLVIVNCTSWVALWLFIRAWAAAGILPPWRWWAAVAGFVVAASVTGSTLLQHWQEALQTPSVARIMVASSIGDVVSLTLLGPLLASAIWMRGGALMWPYAFLACENLTWLVFDVSAVVGGDFAAVLDSIAPLIAAHFVAAAAIAHRWAARDSAA